jgi:hypothetical protein
MKVKQLVLFSVLALGVQGAAQATYPSEAKESYDLPALESYAERHARMGDGDSAPAWGVSKRQVTPHEVFPFGGGFISD